MASFLSSFLSDLSEKLSNLSGYSLMEKYELAGLILGLVILTGFLAWAVLHSKEERRKDKEEAEANIGSSDAGDFSGVKFEVKPEIKSEIKSELENTEDTVVLKKIQEEIAYASKQAAKTEKLGAVSTDPFSNGQWMEAVKKTFKYRTDVNSRRMDDREKLLQGLVIVNIMAPAGLFFYGRDVLENLNSLGLRFGELGIFHKFNERGEKIFSISQATEPGSFDINNMPLCSIKGLTCFFDLSKVTQPKYAFRALLACVHELAHGLKGQILDDKMKPLTQEAITEMLKRIKAGEERTEGKLEEHLVY